MQFVNGMNTSYVQIRNELASEQLIKVQFQVAMSGRYSHSKHFYVRFFVSINVFLCNSAGILSKTSRRDDVHQFMVLVLI